MFSLTMKTDNAAFHEGEDDEQLAGTALPSEVARILREIAERVEAGDEQGPAVDVNGNTVGRYWLRGGRR